MSHALTGMYCSSGGCSSLVPQQRQQQQQQQRRCGRAAAGHASRKRLAVVTAAAAPGGRQPSPQKQQPTSSRSGRNARLYELFEDDGWGVETVSPAPAAPPAQQKQAKQQQKTQPSSKLKHQSSQPQGSSIKRKKQVGTPFADMRSQEGKLGLTLLQRALQDEEQQQQQQDANSSSSSSSGGGGANKPSLDEIRAQLAAAGNTSKRLKPKLPGFPKAGAAAAGGAGAGAAATGLLGARGSSGDELLYDDEEEDWDEDEEATPSFQLTFDEQGRAELESFTDDADGSAAAAAAAESDDLDDFGLSGWGQFGSEEAVPEQSAGKRTGRSKATKGVSPAADDDDAEAELALLRDLSNEDDWGLEALTNPGVSTLGRQLGGGRRSLIDELTAAEEGEEDLLPADSSSGFSGNVQWGGTAGTTGIDLEEQEAILTRYFRPDQVKKIMKEQMEVDESYSVLRKRAVGLGVSDHKMQEKLRIVSGSAAGRKLVSFKSPQTRPMMEKVRQAIFNMLQSRAGTLNSLPRSARWLDLFAGTGSVGLEALSRGVKEAHFVEMDQVVVSKILERNIKSCGFKGRAWTHTSKAEEFLRRSAAVPRFAGGPFDFISVCPPYLLVSYPELFELLDASPLVHPGTILFVEYPKQLAHQIVDSIGPLQRVRDRRYGRTWVALYAASGEGGDEGDDGAGDGGAGAEDDPFLRLGL